MKFIKPTSWKEPSQVDISKVANLLGKDPQGEFQIIVYDEATPLIIENSPFFYDGTPMPTRYWILESDIFNKISKLESSGAIKKVQEEIDISEIQKVHDKYEFARNALIDPSFVGPKPSGGVGGTRKGVKCLHAHVANLLATNDDIIGQWTLDEIAKTDFINHRERKVASSQDESNKRIV